MSDKPSGSIPRKLGRRTLLKARARPRREVVVKPPDDSSAILDPSSSAEDPSICDIATRPSSTSSVSRAETETEEPGTSDVEEGSTTEEDEPGSIREVQPQLPFDPNVPGPSRAPVIKSKKSGSPPIDPKKREQEILGPHGDDLTPEQRTDMLITNCKSLGDNQHECCICRKKIRGGLTHLRMHMRTHTGHRPYKCDLCGAQFVQRAQLRAHSICHSELRPFACQQCGKRFKRAESVKDHMKVHTGEKPFKCSYCERWFGHKCDVVKHERVHTGEKPYSCQHCGRAFSQKGALRVHIRTHTKERPYVCPHKNCEKAFPILSSLQRHLCKHSGTKPFACDLCPVSFFTQTHLKRHRKTHFEEQPEAAESQEREDPGPAVEASSSGSQPTSLLPTVATQPAIPQSSATATATELRCEKCQQAFIHYARWQRHVAICTLAEDPVPSPTVPAPVHVQELPQLPGPSATQPTITSVFHPKKFRRPVPLMKFVSKQGDEIEVDVVSKLSSPATPDMLVVPEVTIEPKPPSESTQGSVDEPEPSALDAPGPSGSAPTSESGTVVFLNREVTIRKLPVKK